MQAHCDVLVFGRLLTNGPSYIPKIVLKILNNYFSEEWEHYLLGFIGTILAFLIMALVILLKFIFKTFPLIIGLIEINRSSKQPMIKWCSFRTEI